MDEIYNKSKDSYKVGKLMKNVVLECLTDTTIHALPNIRKSSNHIGLKLIWTISLIA